MENLVRQTIYITQKRCLCCQNLGGRADLPALRNVFFFLSPSLHAFLVALNVCRLELQLRLIQDPAVAFSVVVSISGDDHSTLTVWKFNKGKGRVGEKKKWHSAKVFERQWLVPGVSLPDLPWSVCEESSSRLGLSLLIMLGEQREADVFSAGQGPLKVLFMLPWRGQQSGERVVFSFLRSVP